MGIRVACKPESLVVSRANGAEEIYAFDHAGRLFTAWRGGRLYRRALDGRVMEKRTDRSGRYPRRHRRFLSIPDRAALLDDAARTAGGARQAVVRGQAAIIWSPSVQADPEHLVSLLTAAARFDGAAGEADSGRFSGVYSPVAILPPDRYLSLVLQVTEGCHWNRCTFCSFYRDHPFRIKPAEEFAAHVDAVLAFFGPGLSLRRGIFLGDANALLLPTDHLVARLDAIARRLPDRSADVAGFIDVFTGGRRRAAELGALRARGLRRIYLGLETGSDVLLTFLNKPQTAWEAIGLGAAAHAASVGVGVIVMAGIGGRRYWREHIGATIRTLEAMRLEGADLVYVSGFTAPETGPYADRARAEGIPPLTPHEVADQIEELEAGARGVVGAGVRVAPYDIDEFLY